MKRFAILTLSVCLALAPTALAENAQGTTLGSWLDGAVASVETWARESGELEARAQAVRTVTPDTVSIRLGTSVTSADEKDAQAQANKVIADVIDALKALGVTDDQMKTSRYDITRKEKSGSFLTSSSEGYQATVTLIVTVQDFELINRIIDTAVEKGANSVGNISFSYSRESEVYHQALVDAIGAARQKAELMAEAAGVELHTLLALREGNQGSAYVNTYASENSKAGGGSQIMAGELEITASVTMIYEIK